MSRERELESLRKQLNTAQEILDILKNRAAGYTSLSIPADLAFELQEKQWEVKNLTRQIQDLEGRQQSKVGALYRVIPCGLLMSIAAVSGILALILVIIFLAGEGPREQEVVPLGSTSSSANTPTSDDSLANPGPAIVEPYCSMFDESPDYVYVERGQLVILKWRWDAVSEQQIWDHINAANYEIYLDDQRIYADRRSEIEYLSDKGWYRVSWYADVGVLAPGKHRSVRILSWNRKIYDGWKWYGPEGDIITEHHHCDIIVR